MGVGGRDANADSEKRDEQAPGHVVQVPLEEVRLNPGQPRQLFPEESLLELAASIRACGILQPLMVRRRGDGAYELISGERRLRAAKIAGLASVPCLVTEADDRDSALFALVENLQRQDLNFLEEALALNRLIQTYRLSQEEAAERIGKSQPAVANKLRLLHLPDKVLQRTVTYGLTERHARALLQLKSEKLQEQALEFIYTHRLNVAQTDAYIARLLEERDSASGQRKTYIVKDVRMFLNTIARSLQIIQSAGVDAQCGKTETEDAILLSIRIAKHTPRAQQRK
jgi:ParB family chromosome partitioning protein